jgi:uncharacterized protein with GYD domain
VVADRKGSKSQGGLGVPLHLAEEANEHSPTQASIAGTNEASSHPRPTTQVNRSEPMKLKSYLITSALAVGLAIPATAQQSSSPHRYVTFFKYTDQAIKAMTDNPQDRAAAISKLSESFGAKVETVYFFPMSGEFDGIVVTQAPSDSAMEAINFVVRSTGSFAKLHAVPVAVSGEFKALMETAKQGAATYAAPGR